MSIESLISLIQQDSLFVPKKLAARDDICDEAKLIFSDVYTEQRFGTIESLKSAMKNIAPSTIEKYANAYGAHSCKQIEIDLDKIYTNLEGLLMVSTNSVH